VIVPTGLTRQITLWSEKTNQAPTPRMGRPDGRIESLDALRGFAIFGILLINIQVFSGYAFIAGEGRSGLAWATWDEPLNRVLDVLVLAKFYSLFSLLFGYSFAMLADKVGDGAVRLHLRRMAGLLVIGLAHSILLWPWDILLLYALVGLILAAFLHRSPITLVAWAMALLTAVAIMTGYGPALGLPQGRGAYATRVLQDSVPALAGGSYPEVLRANLNLTLSVFVEWVQGLRPMRVLAMFLLGAAAARMQLLHRDCAHRWILWAAALIGLALGLPLAIAEIMMEPDGTVQRAILLIADALGAPLLAIGYAATLVLLWQSSVSILAWTRRSLAPVGRMALTNYLLHSAVCVPLFYGFGLGWFADWSLTSLVVLALVFFLAQLILSHLWLSMFTQGPVEWLWRWQIKGRRPAL